LMRCGYGILGAVMHGAGFQWLPSVGKSEANQA
jgi:hypothetical protein